eukprot:544153_1
MTATRMTYAVFETTIGVHNKNHKKGSSRYFQSFSSPSFPVASYWKYYYNPIYPMAIFTHISHSDHCISSLSPVFYIFLIYYYGLINLVPRQHVCCPHMTHASL